MDLNPHPSVLIHVTSALAAFHIIKTGKMKCSSNNDRPYKLMLGEGIYFAENSWQAEKKSNHRSVPQGRAIIVSIVNLGNTYETFYKEKRLTKEKIKKNGYGSVRCYKLNTGTEYCVYEENRVIPLFAKIQFPEETYYIIGTPDGVMKLEQIPIDGMMIKMTNQQIILTDSSNNPFYVISHNEPQLENKLLIFTHKNDFYFNKVILRSNNLTLVDRLQLNGKLYNGSDLPINAGNDFSLEEEDMSDSDEQSEEEEVPSNRYRKGEKPIDIIFVIDATSSAEGHFTATTSRLKSTIDQINSEFPNSLIFSGAIIYSDPANPSQNQSGETDEKSLIENRIAAFKKFEVTSPHHETPRTDDDYDYDDNEFDHFFKEHSKFRFDTVKYPLDKNTLIDLAPVYANKHPNTYSMKGINSLVSELRTVKTVGGNGISEDWAGAIEIALNDVSWRSESLKIVVWIAGSNAKGEKFCGVKSDNEDEMKFENLVHRLIEKKVKFAGISVKCEGGEGGCMRTLDAIKTMYEGDDGDLKFIANEVKQANVNWEKESVDKFAEILYKSISIFLH